MEFNRAKNKNDGAIQVLRKLKNSWHTDTRKLNEWSAFKGKDIDLDYLTNPDFKYTMLYIDKLMAAMNRWRDLDDISPELSKEIRYWNSQGGLCIFLSTVNYTLLLENEVFTPSSLSLAQGYYSHETRKDNPLALMITENSVGLHCWLSAKGAVIDLSIAQKKDFFDFGGEPYIMGKVPDGLLLQGREEPKKIVNKYIKLFAKKAGLTEKQWTDQHMAWYQEFKKKTAN